MRQANKPKEKEQHMFTSRMPQPRDWSEAGLTAYLSQEREDPLEGIEALAKEVRTLAETDVADARRRARQLHSACWSRVKDEARRLRLGEPWLLEGGNVVREQERRAFKLAMELRIQFDIELDRRERALRRRAALSRSVPDRFALQDALAEIDRRAAREARNVSEANAFGIFLRHGLITQEQFERARDRPGNTLWNYSGQG
jgi:hypothetical protein